MQCSQTGSVISRLCAFPDTSSLAPVLVLVDLAISCLILKPHLLEPFSDSTSIPLRLVSLLCSHVAQNSSPPPLHSLCLSSPLTCELQKEGSFFPFLLQLADP